MTLDKAIEILKKDLLVPGSVDKLDFQDSEQLGIEALKRIEWYRKYEHITHNALLPGETPIIDTKRSLHHIKENLQGIGEHP